MESKYRKYKIYQKEIVEEGEVAEDENEPFFIGNEEYNSNGDPVYLKRIISDIDYEESKCTYNSEGDLIEKECFSTEVGNKEITKVEYDNINNVSIQRTYYNDGENDRIETKYNSDKKPLEIKYYEDENDSSLYKVEEFIYLNGKLTEERNLNGNMELVSSAQYDYDNNDNKIKVIETKDDGTIIITENTYNSKNNLLKCIVTENDVTVASQEYEYDRNNNVFKEIIHSDYDTHVCEYEYDLNGNCIKRAYASPETKYINQYQYNRNGLIVEDLQTKIDMNNIEKKVLFTFKYE